MELFNAVLSAIGLQSRRHALAEIKFLEAAMAALVRRSFASLLASGPDLLISTAVSLQLVHPPPQPFLRP